MTMTVIIVVEIETKLPFSVVVMLCCVALSFCLWNLFFEL